MEREIARADMVLCPSYFVRDTMISNGVPPEKCFVNPFGVNTSQFQPRTEIPSRPRFISVGTICVRKGFQYLFRAFELVKKELPEAELIVVGDYKIDFKIERPKWEGTFTHYRTRRPRKIGRDSENLFGLCPALGGRRAGPGYSRGDGGRSSHYCVI